MKLLEIALKELNLIKTQKVSLLLIFFFPVITILAIGIAFGNIDLFTGTGFSKVPVGIYVPTANEQTKELISELNLYPSINLIQFSSPEDVIESIKKRKTRIGIIAREPETGYSPLEIELIFDNSTLLETQVTLFVTETILNEVSYKKATEILEGMIYNIESIKSTIKKEMKTIDGFINKLNQSSHSLEKLETRLNQINLTEMKNELNTFDLYYVQSKNDIANTRNEIYNAQSQLAAYKIKIESERNKLINYRNTLISLNSQLSVIIRSSPPEIANQLIPVQSQLNYTISELNSTIGELDQALTDIENTNQKLNQTLSKLNEVDSRLDYAKSSVESFKNTINSMEKTLNEIKLMISEAKSSRQSIMRDLKETKNQMNELSAKLDNLSSLSPESIVRPLNVIKEPLYESGEVSVITPMATAIVLLLTSLLLTSISVILERNQGAELRAKLSPTMHITWISGKILGQLIFALLEAVIILTVAYFGFSVMIQGNITELLAVLVIVAFAFISIGLFITNFTKTQSTAILSSLLVSVPLIFLSGMILPTSFMPSLVKEISDVLPLTVATELITAVLVRGIPLNFLVPQILLLLVPALAMIAFTLAYPKIKET
jgi:ABC-type multidrug transport system permease subunit